MLQCGVVVEPGGPAEAERAVDQGLVADRDVGADLEEVEAEVIEEIVDETPSREASRLEQKRGSSRDKSAAENGKAGQGAGKDKTAGNSKPSALGEIRSILSKFTKK